MTIEKICSQYGFDVDELEDIFAVVCDLVELAQEKLEENEPAAVNSIQRLRDMRSELSDWGSFRDDNYLVEVRA